MSTAQGKRLCRPAFGRLPFSIYKFTEYFKTKIILYFREKKTVCVGYDEGNVDANLFEVHQKRNENVFEG